MQTATETTMKLKKAENDLKKAQTVAEHSIKELNEKNKLLANSKVTLFFLADQNFLNIFIPFENLFNNFSLTFSSGKC